MHIYWDKPCYFLSPALVVSPLNFQWSRTSFLFVDTLIEFYWYLWIIDSHKQRRQLNKEDTMNSSHLSPPEAVTSNLKFLCHIRKTFPLSQLLRQARGNENPFILTRIYKGPLEEWVSYPCWNGMCHSKSNASDLCNSHTYILSVWCIV